MNYYAQGGQAHGIKSLAQDLSQYGRGGDTMVAHISSDEARLLKSLGGSGTINPTTGLPEFFSLGNVFKPVQQAVAAINPFNPGSAVSKVINQIPIVGQANQALNNLGTQIFQPLEKAIVQPASAGLANLDKSVGKAIPGGWGTIAAIAGSAMGLPTAAMIGLGALNGSGVMHKGGNFNLQGAIMGGAMAYGASELGEYARAAGGAANAVEKVAEQGLAPISATATEMTADQIAQNSANQMNSALASESANVLRSVPQPASFTSNVLNGNFGEAAGQLGTKFTEGASQLGTNIMNAPSDIYQSGINAKDAVANYNYSGAIDNATKGMSDTLSGAGKILTGSADPAAAAAVKAGTIMSPTLAAGMTAYAGMGLAALDQQRQYLKDQAASGAISNQQYNEELAKINAQAEEGRKIVAANPLQINPGIAGLEEGPSLYARENSNETLYDKNPYGGTTLYAAGGTVAQSIANPSDDQTKMPNGSPLQQIGAQNSLSGLRSILGLGGNQPAQQSLANIEPYQPNDGFPSQLDSGTGSSQPTSAFGGLGGQLGGSGSQGAFPLQGQYGIVKMAAGGMPRFLSGGGDGMSDSIKASINGSQEARLADGEFVVPADVVSHMGNGSSKAGAKQLYSMMDRVRQARTGRKSQGKQINPRKLMVA